MRPAEACGCSKKPASERSAITFRMDAGLSPSRFERANVREPTGSPVEIKVSTRAVRISRSRFPILGSRGIRLYQLSLILPVGCERNGAARIILHKYIRCGRAPFRLKDRPFGRILGDRRSGRKLTKL